MQPGAVVMLWWQVMWDVALKSSLLCLLAALALTMQRRASAAYRHLLCTLTFGSLLALPLLVALPPAWKLPVLPPASVPSARAASASSSSCSADADSRTGSTRRGPAAWTQQPVLVRLI